jgi:putative peptide zinc metalloprotease protein
VPRILSREGIIDTEHAVLEAETITDTVARKVPRLAEGIELIGEYQGSGFQEPKYILRRPDGQIIQLPRLLYLLAATLDGQRDLHEVAAVLSAEFGRIVQAEQVAFLIDNRFQPAGIMAADPTAAQSGTAPTTTMRPDPLLALKVRVGVVSEPTVWRIAGVFQPMFWPPVILAALAGFVTLDVVIIARGGLGQIVPSGLALVYQPALTLLVLAIVLVSATFHECGHVSACRYGGARPGVMGLGLYLVWPALYSTVTDSYRLNRVGRLRTDLGGVYFNTVFIAGMNLAYLGTGSPWLLVAIVALHFETAMQFLPMIRLDGYYILSDLIGVPDLFSWMGPVLMSMIPGRAAHSRVRELKPWVRATITLWVLIVVPYLLYWLVGFLIVVPQVLPVVWHRLVWLAHAEGTALATGRPAEAALGVVNIILLLLPWVGSLLVLGMLLNGLLRMALARWGLGHLRVERSSVARATAVLAATGLLAGCVSADAVGLTGYNGNEGNGSSRVLGVNGGTGSNANGGDGGTSGTGPNGGNGGNGTAGDGGNSIGGNGGNGNGGNGGDGVVGAPGVHGANGADGASGGSSSGSGSVADSGHLTSRVIALSGVTSVVVGASFAVRVTVGEPEQATIRIDDNRIDRVAATVTDGTLRLGLKPGSNVRNTTLFAEITVRHLDRLSTSGTSQVTLLSPVTGPALQLVTSGASKVTGPLKVDHLKASQSGASVLALSGHAGDLYLRAAGISRLLGPELTVEDLHAQLSGASQATVAVNGALATTAEGTSVLRYHGTPSIIRRQAFGASSIVSDSRK